MAFQCRMLLMISKLNKRNAKNQICISHKLCFRFDYRFLPLHLWVELGGGHTVTHRGSFNLTATFWTFSASAHFLNCFEFFLTQNYFSDFIFIESKKWTNQSDPIIFNWQVAGRLRERIWLWVKTVDHWAGVRGTARSRFDQKIERQSYGSLLRRVYRNNLDLIIMVLYKL